MLFVPLGSIFLVKINTLSSHAADEAAYVKNNTSRIQFLQIFTSRWRQNADVAWICSTLARLMKFISVGCRVQRTACRGLLMTNIVKLQLTKHAINASYNMTTILLLQLATVKYAVLHPLVGS